MVYHLPNKITEENIDQFAYDMQVALSKNEDIVLDAYKTMYVSSVAIRTIMVTFRDLKKQGNNLHIVNTKELMEEILVTTGVRTFVDDINPYVKRK